MKAAVRDQGGHVFTIDVTGSLIADDVRALAEAVTAIPLSARCVVLVGDDEVFNSGATREGLLNTADAITECGAAFPRLLLDIPVPTIAAMAGHAVGGGLLLGLWCDQLVLAADRLYGANFMALGFTPGMGATVALEDAFGTFLAREMLYTGRLLTGRELRAHAAPLPHVVPREEVEPHAFRLATELAQLSSKSLRLLRHTLAARRRTRLEQALRDEREMHQQIFQLSETRAQIIERLPQ